MASQIPKITFIGDTNVGKSSIIAKIKGSYDPQNVSNTLGAESSRIELKSGSGSITVDLWDTAGSEEFSSMAPEFCKGSKAIVVVFSINDSLTFQNIENWIRFVSNVYTGDQVYIVGNKCDLEHNIQKDAAVKLSNDHHAQYFEVSATSGFGITDFVESLASAMMEKKPKQNEPETKPKEERKDRREKRRDEEADIKRCGC